jgi:hypothetical protein
MSLASAYWHGDENSDRLIRVYGTAFATQAELDEYLKQLEEAAKRDHRVIGKNLRLFHIDETVGQGLILWTPKGSIVRKELQTFIAAELKKQGYTEVFTPHIGSLDLYKTSATSRITKTPSSPPSSSAKPSTSSHRGLLLRRHDAPRRGRLAAPRRRHQRAHQGHHHRRRPHHGRRQARRGLHAQAHELPAPRQDLRPAARTPTATCPSASPSSAPSIAGNSPANSTA